MVFSKVTHTLYFNLLLKTNSRTSWCYVSSVVYFDWSCFLRVIHRKKMSFTSFTLGWNHVGELLIAQTVYAATRTFPTSFTVAGFSPKAEVSP